MSKLVRGFSNIMKPMNLVANGDFRINQRGNFLTSAPCKVGDYVADRWKISYNGIDYCEIHNESYGEQNYLRFSGYGKKGQSITVHFYYVTASEYPQLDIRSDHKEFTTSVTGYNIKGKTRIKSLPFQFTNDVTLYQKNDHAFYLGQRLMAVTSVYGISNCTVNILPYFNIELEQDGEFDLRIYSFQMIEGLHKNPPFIQNDYALDLMRCKRYYQRGRFEVQGLSGDNSAYYLIGGVVNFPVEMAGTPSIYIDNVQVFEDVTNNEISASCSVYSNLISSISFTQTASIVNTNSNKLRQIELDWTAEV